MDFKRWDWPEKLFCSTPTLLSHKRQSASIYISCKCITLFMIFQHFKTSHLLITLCHFISYFPLPVCSAPPPTSYSLCFFFPCIYLLISPCSLSCPAFPLLYYLLLISISTILLTVHIFPHIRFMFLLPLLQLLICLPLLAPCSSCLLLRTRAAVRSNLATREFWTKSVTADIPAETRVISHPDNQHF